MSEGMLGDDPSRTRERRRACRAAWLCACGRDCRPIVASDRIGPHDPRDLDRTQFVRSELRILRDQKNNARHNQTHDRRDELEHEMTLPRLKMVMLE